MFDNTPEFWNADSRASEHLTNHLQWLVEYSKVGKKILARTFKSQRLVRSQGRSDSI